MNAVVAGYLSGEAVINVTRGAVEKLTGDELQAPMAHEFGHILKGDMALNMLLKVCCETAGADGRVALI